MVILFESAVSELMSELALPGLVASDRSACCTELVKSLTAVVSAALPAPAASCFSWLTKAVTAGLAVEGCSTRPPSVDGAFASVAWIFWHAAVTVDVEVEADGEVVDLADGLELPQPAARIMTAASAGVNAKTRNACLRMPLPSCFPSVVEAGAGAVASRGGCDGVCGAPMSWTASAC